MEWLPFWTEALLLPLLGLGGNTAIRWSLDLERRSTRCWRRDWVLKRRR
jgi:hypothetical protein